MSVRLTVACIALSGLLVTALARAEAPVSEYFLPKTTKLLISLPDPDIAREQFNASQFGELVNHEEMADFMDALENQMNDRGRMAERLGIAPADLDGVYDGEVALAVMQPDGERDAFATALIVKIRPGDPDEIAKKMLLDIVQRRLEKYGKGRNGRYLSSTAWVEDFDRERENEVYRITTPKVGEQPPISTYYFFDPTGNYFLAVDHEAEARALYQRIPEVLAHGVGAGVDSLGTIDPFKVCMQRVADAWGEGEPQVRWFVDPFDYLRVIRAEDLAMGTRERRRGRDMIDVYADEGFDAIGGVGGWVNFSEDGHEVLHRTFVYAPAVDREAKDPTTEKRLAIEAKMHPIPEDIEYAGPENKKYLLGARMLHFFNEGKLKPHDWLPDDLATHMAFHWHMQRAFKYSETLVNSYSDDVKNQEVWWGTLDSIRDDVDGPKVDIRKDIVMHIGTRATYISDYARPIDVNSEQTAVAMEITGDPAVVSAAIDTLMADDPDAVRHEVGEVTVWEVKPPPAGPGGSVSDDPAAYMVTHGHLFRATHADILKKLATMPAEQLNAADDLELVNTELDRLSDDKESFRYFDRLDRSMEQNWELIRQGKFPQSDSLLANMAARSQGLDPRDPDTKEREQEIDGDSLPGFAFAKPFLGPSGMFIKGVEDGWLITGAVLTKE